MKQTANKTNHFFVVWNPRRGFVAPPTADDMYTRNPEQALAFKSAEWAALVADKGEEVRELAVSTVTRRVSPSIQTL